MVRPPNITRGPLMQPHIDDRAPTSLTTATSTQPHVNEAPRRRQSPSSTKSHSPTSTTPRCRLHIDTAHAPTPATGHVDVAPCGRPHPHVIIQMREGTQVSSEPNNEPDHLPPCVENHTSVLYYLEPCTYLNIYPY